MLVYYIKSMGSLASTALVCGVLLYVGSNVALNIWLSQWTDDEVIAQNVHDAKIQTDFRITIYATFGILACKY